MAYSREEIEALQKRLEAAESQDLFIAQGIASFLCTIEFNMTGFYLTGEQRQLYYELWSKKLEATREELAASQSVKSVFETFVKFDKELSDFLRAEKVKTAAEATDIAHSFIKKYSTVALPLKAVREKDVWVVDIDVGALAVKIAKVKVDARTGDILGHEIPEK